MNKNGEFKVPVQADYIDDVFFLKHYKVKYQKE